MSHNEREAAFIRALLAVLDWYESPALQVSLAEYEVER